MRSEKPEELIEKFLHNTCTPEERIALESWYNAAVEATEEPDDAPDYEKLQAEIWKTIKHKPKKNKMKWSILAAAAVFFIGCSVLYLSIIKDNIQKPTAIMANKIMPGGNKAELLLADGSIVPLSDVKAGILAKQNGVTITKLQNGQLSYEGQGVQNDGNINYNTLVTPKGGQFQINLPDGTKAWLNSASSLKFPTAFNLSDRIVEVSGEVYFEVAVNKKQPFKVICPGQTIVVLGTHFNVNAYPEEQIVKTSLLEGSVKVITERKTVTIRPGQQTIFDAKSKETTIQEGDVEGVLAWKDGYFDFKNEDVKSIMRKLSRWYNIDVSYTDNFVTQRFTGSVSRFSDASKVLKMLEYTGTIHFKTEGRRITVMP